MTAYTKKNLRYDVEDQAPRFGMPGRDAGAVRPNATRRGHARSTSLHARARASASRSDTSTPGQEEVYVVVRGSARVKVEDEIVTLDEWDAIRFDKDTMRDMEAGPDGVDYLAFGAGEDPNEVEMAHGWWTD